MRLLDSLTRFGMPEELRDNRAIQFFTALTPFLMAGVVCVAFVGRPLGAWLFGALTLTGVGVGGWFARRGSAVAAATAPLERAQVIDRQDTPARVTADFARGRADTVLMLDMRSREDSGHRDGLDFLSSVQPFSDSEADSSLRFEPRNMTQNTGGELSCWALRERADHVVARFVQLPIGADLEQGRRRPSASVLRQLRLHRRGLTDFFGTLFTGRSVVRSPLKGVVLCCRLADMGRHLDSLIAAAARELEAIGRNIGGHFPLYVVATDLHEIGGFAEFATALKSRCGAAVLDEAIGLAFDKEERSKDALHQRLRDVSTQLAHWRPALLQAIDEQARRDLRQRSTGDSTARKAQVYEFPRQLAMLSSVLADFCWRAVAVAQGDGRGPVLRGVFYTGLVMPDVNPYMGSIETAAPFERRAFAWNLLTTHIVGFTGEPERVVST